MPCKEAQGVQGKPGNLYRSCIAILISFQSHFPQLGHRFSISSPFSPLLLLTLFPRNQ